MRSAVALTALFLSGFAGLLYEVCWLRQAALSFGSTTFAMGTVLAVFFLGLALGSYAFGRIAAAREGDFAVREVQVRIVQAFTGSGEYGSVPDQGRLGRKGLVGGWEGFGPDLARRQQGSKHDCS